MLLYSQEYSFWPGNHNYTIHVQCRFCFLRGCGCVISEKALKEAPSENCHKVIVLYTSLSDHTPPLVKWLVYVHVTVITE